MILVSQNAVLQPSRESLDEEPSLERIIGSEPSPEFAAMVAEQYRRLIDTLVRLRDPVYQASSVYAEYTEKRPDAVKIWVDDRNGTVKKLSPPLYRAESVPTLSARSQS